MAEIKKSIQYPSIPDSLKAERQFFEDIFSLIKDLRTELTTKPDWIAVTYINSWVDYDTDRTSEYYKDTFGNVHLKLNCKNGTTAYPFVISEGHRPIELLVYPIFAIPSGTTVTPCIVIRTDGVVYFLNHTTDYCLYGEIIYRAA